MQKSFLLSIPLSNPREIPFPPLWSLFGWWPPTPLCRSCGEEDPKGGPRLLSRFGGPPFLPGHFLFFHFTEERERAREIGILSLHGLESEGPLFISFFRGILSLPPLFILGIFPLIFPLSLSRPEIPLILLGLTTSSSRAPLF